MKYNAGGVGGKSLLAILSTKKYQITFKKPFGDPKNSIEFTTKKIYIYIYNDV